MTSTFYLSMAMSLFRSSRRRPTSETRRSLRTAVFLAYSSDETGREEIYVQAISGEGGKLLVSVDGGIWPRWSPSGNKLFYRQGTVMMAVSVKLNPTFRPGIPRELFNGNYAERFDVFPDGDFAMVTLADADLRELEVVVNWSEELKRLVPTN